MGGISSLMMLLLLSSVPLFWLFALWSLSWLEERTIAPEDRAHEINRFLDSEDPDQIERGVAELLSHALRRSSQRVSTEA